MQDRDEQRACARNGGQPSQRERTKAKLLEELAELTAQVSAAAARTGAKVRAAELEGVLTSAQKRILAVTVSRPLISLVRALEDLEGRVMMEGGELAEAWAEASATWQQREFYQLLMQRDDVYEHRLCFVHVRRPVSSVASDR